MTDITPRTFNSISELTAAIGEDLGYGDWLEVTQDRIDAFADATGDHQWIHVDPERAKSGPFGTTIAHGYLTLSLLPVLGNRVMDIRGFSMMINYGLEKVRFPAAVPVGSRIRAGIELTSRGKAMTDGGVGDTVAAYLPDEPFAVIAFLATASLGAVWSSCGQDYAPEGAAIGIDDAPAARTSRYVAAGSHAVRATLGEAAGGGPAREQRGPGAPGRRGEGARAAAGPGQRACRPGPAGQAPAVEAAVPAADQRRKRRREGSMRGRWLVMAGLTSGRRSRVRPRSAPGRPSRACPPAARPWP